MPNLEHPMTAEEADKRGARRCYYHNVPALAYPARAGGYVNVWLLHDPGNGSMYQANTAPGNCQFLDGYQHTPHRPTFTDGGE